MKKTQRPLKFRWVFLLLLQSLTIVPNASTAADKCQSPQKGSWVNLETLNAFDFTPDCTFVYSGANCAVSGNFLSAEGNEGPLTLNNSEEPTNFTCFSKGEHSCNYRLEGDVLSVECSPSRPVKYVRLRSKYNEQKLKALMAAKSENAQTELTLHYYDTQQTGKLEAHLEKLSQLKVLEATTALGYQFFYGARGFQRNYAEALFWNRLAASRGSQEGRNLAGTQYLYGLGTERNFAKAEEYFLMAAKNEDVVPQKALAAMYLMDRPTKKNTEKARHWLRKATRLGDSEAAAFLATLPPAPEVQKQMKAEAPVEVKEPPAHPKLLTKTLNFDLDGENTPVRSLASGDPDSDLEHYMKLQRRLGVSFGLMLPFGDFGQDFSSTSMLGLHFVWEAIPPFGLRISTQRASSYHKNGPGSGKLTVSQFTIGTQASFPDNRKVPFAILEGTFNFNDVAFGTAPTIQAGSDAIVTTVGLNVGFGMDFVVGRELSLGFEALFHYLLPKRVNLSNGNQYNLGSSYSTIAFRITF